MMKKSDIARLESQGCYSDDWDLVKISAGTNLGKIRNVVFRGSVEIGSDAEIINVHGGLENVSIGNGVRIVNVAKIKNSKGATCGIGAKVDVLDETGSRPVRIYPGLSAQTATLAARIPDYAAGTLDALIDRHIGQMPDRPDIGDNVEISDSGTLSDVKIWEGCKIEGASRLRNCSIVSNSKGPGHSTYIGQGVDIEDCIVEDATVQGGAFLRNTYVGQGCVIDKSFTSHDSLFFANCTMENGEACAVLGGPFTVSMHKSSLLIACQTGFMNAGSGTNMSNHMYKLGPVHWGILERGVKTSSNAYLMHGSRIGAFCLLLGDHKSHPDSSHFPFSYLIGDARGNTTLVPGAMLKSYGLVRDEGKWQTRDRRTNMNLRKLNDRVNTHVFNPYTIGLIMDAIDTADKLLAEQGEDDEPIKINGMTVKGSSLKKGKTLYDLAVGKYLSTHIAGRDSEAKERGEAGYQERWTDLGGQVMPESTLRTAMQAESIEALEAIFDKAYEEMERQEKAWISANLSDFMSDPDRLQAKAAEYDAILEKDRQASVDMIRSESNMLSLL